jgi:hypothetical protein
MVWFLFGLDLLHSLAADKPSPPPERRPGRAARHVPVHEVIVLVRIVETSRCSPPGFAERNQVAITRRFAPHPISPQENFPEHLIHYSIKRAVYKELGKCHQRILSG